MNVGGVSMKAIIVIGLLGFSSQALAEPNACRLETPVGALPELVDFLGNEMTDWSEEYEASMQPLPERVDFLWDEAIDWWEDDPTSIDTVNLPEGDISGEQLIQILEGWKEESPSLLEMFQRVSDGQKRTISGEAVRDAVQLAGLTLPNFIPADALEEIVIENGQAWVRLDSDQEIDVPSIDTWVLDFEDAGDPDSNPYLVDSLNSPYQHASSSYTLKINEELLFDLDENGLHGIRKGDLKGAKFIFSKDIAIRSVHGEPGVQHMGDAVVLVTDANGEPLIENGYYVPKSADEWIEVTAGSDVSHVPVHRMARP